MPRPEHPNLDSAVTRILKYLKDFELKAHDALRWYVHYKMGQFGGSEADLKRAVKEMMKPLGEELAEFVVAYDDIFAYLGSDSELTLARRAIFRGS